MTQHHWPPTPCIEIRGIHRVHRLRRADLNRHALLGFRQNLGLIRVHEHKEPPSNAAAAVGPMIHRQDAAAAPPAAPPAIAVCIVAHAGTTIPGAFSMADFTPCSSCPRGPPLFLFVSFFAHFSFSFRLNTSRKLRRALA